MVTTTQVATQDPILEALRNNAIGSIHSERSSFGLCNDPHVVEIAAKLAFNTSLRELSLPGYHLPAYPHASNQHKLTDVAANAISEALGRNTTLTSLNLPGNKLTPVAATTMGAALRGNSDLQSLNLSGNLDLGAEGVTAIAQGVRFNRGLASLDLSWLIFSYPTPHPAEAVATALRQMLENNTSLTSLNLSSNTAIRAVGVEEIAPALASNTSLTSLQLSRVVAEDAGAIAIALALTKNDSLTSLDLSANQLTDAAAAALVQMLKVNSKLTSLNLADNQFTDAKLLAQIITSSTCITSLHLERNPLTDVGPLAQALATNSSLTELTLTLAPHTNEAAAALALALTTNTSLRSLVTYGNPISDEAVAAIALALRVNTSLTSLKILNPISDEGVTAMTQALTVNPTITDLGRSPCVLSDHPISKSLIERNLHNLERKERLEILCARALVYNYFTTELDEESRNRVYRRVWFAVRWPADDFQFGEHNVFRLWSTFAQAVNAAEVNAREIALGSRTIAHYQMGNQHYFWPAKYYIWQHFA